MHSHCLKKVENTLRFLLEGFPFAGTQVPAPWECRFAGSLVSVLAGLLAKSEVHPFPGIGRTVLTTFRAGMRLEAVLEPLESGGSHRGDKGLPQGFSLFSFCIT